jgi:hypothetical protein
MHLLKSKAASSHKTDWDHAKKEPAENTPAGPTQ